MPIDLDQDKALAADALGDLTKADFVARWREIVGEPPSIMLDDRREMIAILVAAAGAPAEAPESDEYLCQMADQRARRAA